MARDKGNSFLRVFQILDLVARSDKTLNAGEIGDATELPRPTAHRLCQMLISEGFLQYEVDGKRMGPGPRLVGFGANLMRSSQLNLERHVVLENLVDDIGETCNLSIPNGTRMIYADRVESDWPIRVQLPTGTRVPLHCTASGKLYLSSLPPSKRKRLLARLTLERFTEATLVDPEELDAALSKVRKAGYGWDDQEFIHGLVAVAVPILDSKTRFYGGLAVHGPLPRFSMSKATDCLPAMRKAAHIIASLIAETSDSED